MRKRTHNKTRRVAILCALVALASAAFSLAQFSFAQRAENMFLDYHLSHTNLAAKDNKIVVLLATDRTLQEIGQWPVKRGVYADLISGPLQGADAIALDILFTDYTEEAEDAKLLAAMEEHGAVAIAHVLDSSTHYPVVPAKRYTEAAAAVCYVNSFPRRI